MASHRATLAPKNRDFSLARSIRPHPATGAPPAAAQRTCEEGWLVRHDLRSCKPKGLSAAQMPGVRRPCRTTKEAASCASVMTAGKARPPPGVPLVVTDDASSRGLLPADRAGVSLLSRLVLRKKAGLQVRRAPVWAVWHSKVRALITRPPAEQAFGPRVGRHVHADWRLPRSDTGTRSLESRPRAGHPFELAFLTVRG
jgi:hypothetical protein